MTQAPASSAPPQIVARDLTKTYRMGDSVIGALQGMLDAYLDYGKKRIQRNSGVAASEEAVIQLVLLAMSAATRDITLLTIL